MTSALPDLPVLPAAVAANDSARAWAETDAALHALLAAGVAVDRALLRWGAELLRTGRAEDAVSAFRAATALAPGDALAWTNLGIALTRTGAEAAGVDCLERSVSLARAQPDAWILLGMGREKQGATERAEHAYRVALELSPASAPAWRFLGALLQRKGDTSGAIQAFQACLAHGPPDVPVAASLGKMFYEAGRFAEARAAYAAATAGEPGNVYFGRMARRTRFLDALIQGAPVDGALASLEERGDGRAAAPLAEEERRGLFEAVAGALTGFGHHEAALRLARRRVELWPESAAARYLLASLLGTAELSRSPDEYVVASFDAFAERFDAQLVDVLGYDVPQKLCALVRDLAEPGRLLDALDAGCGTGLCGPLLRPLARRLTGVDLSPKMLARAAERGLYDSLVCEELTAFIARSAGAFDLIVAADVLIYFGELRPIFEAAAGAIRSGGLLAFSTESSSADGRHLRPTGRFAHHPGFVRAAVPPGFEVLTSQATTLRFESTARVPGELFVFRRRST